MEAKAKEAKSRKGLVFKDPRLKKQMTRMFVPFLLQELVVVLTTLLVNLVLKWWGCHQEITVAVTNVFQIFFVYNLAICGVTYVANLFISQHYGRGAIDDVKRDYYVMLKISIAIGVISFILAETIPELLLSFSEGYALKKGVEYLRLFAPVFLLLGPSTINYALMKNIHLEKYCTISSIITFMLVFVLESTMMFAVNIENLALELAAVSMISARLVEFILLFVIINKKCLVKFKFKEFIKSDFSRFKSIVYYGSPVIISKISWSIGFVMVTVIANKIPNADGLLTAHSLMITYQNIVTCMSNAMACVVAVVIGRELGANRIRKAKDHGADISRLALFMGIVQIAVFLLFLPIARFTTPDLSSEVSNYLWKVFLIQSVAIIPRLYNSYYINGLFSSGGDTLFILLVDGITAWATIVPLGICGVNYFSQYPLLIYTLIQLEELFKVPFTIWRYKTKKWAFNITKKKGIVFNE